MIMLKIEKSGTGNTIVFILRCEGKQYKKIKGREYVNAKIQKKG